MVAQLLPHPHLLPQGPSCTVAPFYLPDGSTAISLAHLAQEMGNHIGSGVLSPRPSLAPEINYFDSILGERAQ